MILLIILFGIVATFTSTIVVHKSLKSEVFVKTFNTFMLAIMALIFFLKVNDGFALFIFTGLLFSSAGDGLLAYSKRSTKRELCFLLGTMFFIMGYLTYGVSLIVLTWCTLSFGLLLGILIVIFIGYGQFKIMDKEKIKGKLPLIIPYLTQISILFIGGIAAFADPSLKVSTGIIFLLGTILLYTSDSIIGYNMFTKPIKNPSLYIMPTYVVGQVLMLLGTYTLIS